ncbi:MAG: hypothetical protein AABX47_01450 [Nanoarchaeota archaeon]
MIPKNTAKIIRLLLRRTDRIGLNINQIAKACEISVGSAFKILKSLENDRLASCQKIGNGSFYSLDLGNKEAVKICELLLLEERRNLKGYARLYAKDIETFGKAKMIVLFGSVLRGNRFNDVDALFVTERAKEAADFCDSLSAARTKVISPLIIPIYDLIREMKKGGGVVGSIVKEGVIIKGEDSFVEAIRDGRKDHSIGMVPEEGKKAAKDQARPTRGRKTHQKSGS